MRATSFVTIAIFAWVAAAQSPADQNVDKTFHFTYVDTPVAAQELSNAARMVTDIGVATVDNNAKTVTMRGTKEAMEIFQLNRQRNGDLWPVHVGLARGYAATGDTKQALEQARKALAQAPDALKRDSLQAMVATLEAGGTVAQ